MKIKKSVSVTRETCFLNKSKIKKFALLLLLSPVFAFGQKITTRTVNSRSNLFTAFISYKGTFAKHTDPPMGHSIRAFYRPARGNFLSTLTFGYGMQTGSYDGSAPVTLNADSTTLRTIANSLSLSQLQTKLNGYGVLAGANTWSQANNYTDSVYYSTVGTSTINQTAHFVQSTASLTGTGGTATGLVSNALFTATSGTTSTTALYGVQISASTEAGSTVGLSHLEIQDGATGGDLNGVRANASVLGSGRVKGAAGVVSDVGNRGVNTRLTYAYEFVGIQPKTPVGIR